MITISGKQNDEVETSIVHIMQMYTFNIGRGIAEVKIFLLSWPALPDTLLGGPIRHLQFFFSSSVQLPCGQARKMVQLVGMQANQIQIHILIHKLIHIFHAY